ncbi:hypothetical protein ACFQHO_13450 [Actinomadura yumaensis]|uniref:hypothetical protein n=1 Tax=Actinomadura yumaensis TaxID=111807 RepID=UPI0036195DAB
MTAGASAESPAVPVLVVRTGDRVHRLRPGGSYRIGRDPAAEIPWTTAASRGTTRCSAPVRRAG